MYRIPPELDLSAAVGEFTTQLCVGAFDIQFSLGAVHFAVQSPVRILRGERCVARWEPDRWPDPGFQELLNQTVVRCEIVSDRLIVIGFENGLELHLIDGSDHYESMQIRIDGDPTLWVI